MGKYTADVEDHLVLPAVASLTRGSEYRLRRIGKPVPAPVPIRLLIDTGAKRSALIPGIVRHLDPPGGERVRVTTPLSTGTTQLFWVRLEFPETKLASLEPVHVASLTMPPELAQFHGLLGRDLLFRLHSLYLEGLRDRYTLRDRPGLFDWLRRWL